MGAGAELYLARFAALDAAAWSRAAQACLTDAELRQAARLGDPDHAIAHQLGRAILRLIGAATAGVEPAELEIGQRSGKPFIRDLPELRTSISHTGRLVAVAACHGVEVGVDVEAPISATVSLERLAARFFTADEAQRLRAAPSDCLAPEFLRYWTAKEAVGKALGVGIIPALRGAVVRPDGNDTRLVSVWRGPGADAWTLHQLCAPSGQELIAVALPAPDVPLAPVRALTCEALGSGRL